VQDGLLFRGSEPVALGQRAIALLRALIERPGAVVAKDESIHRTGRCRRGKCRHTGDGAGRRRANPAW
jgi:DNA-binding response OmpR family regulator